MIGLFYQHREYSVFSLLFFTKFSNKLKTKFSNKFSSRKFFIHLINLYLINLQPHLRQPTPYRSCAAPNPTPTSNPSPQPQPQPQPKPQWLLLPQPTPQPLPQSSRPRGPRPWRAVTRRGRTRTKMGNWVNGN